MASRADSKKTRFAQAIAAAQPAIADELLFAELKSRLAPVSDSYLRQLLRESGVPLTAAVEGVSLHSLPDNRRTLIALAELYHQRDLAGRRAVRDLALEAKTRLRFLVARTADDDLRAAREEMLLWVLTWLENPQAFQLWVTLREHAVRSQKQE